MKMTGGNLPKLGSTTQKKKYKMDTATSQQQTR